MKREALNPPWPFTLAEMHQRVDDKDAEIARLQNESLSRDGKLYEKEVWERDKEIAQLKEENEMLMRLKPWHTPEELQQTIDEYNNRWCERDLRLKELAQQWKDLCDIREQQVKIGEDEVQRLQKEVRDSNNKLRHSHSLLAECVECLQPYCGPIGPDNQIDLHGMQLIEKVREALKVKDNG